MNAPGFQCPWGVLGLLVLLRICCKFADMLNRFLKSARVVLEVFLWTALTGAFVTGITWWAKGADFLAKLQLLPAAMAFAITVFICWLIITLIFGRIYCSTICPMGAFQDAVARLLHRRPYRYATARNRLRYCVLAVVAVCLIAGIGGIPLLLDPYSGWGRFAANCLGPVGGRVASVSLAGVVIAVATLVVIGVCAALRGRLWCNTICPVGSTLGLISRYSIMHIDINTDRCIQCGKCASRCKAQCIDLQSHVVDTSRCVVCFNCLPGCPNDAIHYTPHSHRLQLPMMMRAGMPGRAAGASPTGAPPTQAVKEIDRRRFLKFGIILATAPVVLKADSLVTVADSDATSTPVPLPQLPPLPPPGAGSVDAFIHKCTSCGLCMANCPTGVLRPSVDEYGITHILHPMLDYNRARCAYDCTLCNNLCPTGALQPMTLSLKQQTPLGKAEVVQPNCIGCGRCKRACPVDAIAMVRGEGNRLVSSVSHDICIGCGACQSVCPETPYKAIYVAPIK